MAFATPIRWRLVVLLMLLVVLVGTTTLMVYLHRPQGTSDSPMYGKALPPSTARTSELDSDEKLLEKVAIIFPINDYTDMQFYRNLWVYDYLYPVCDWPGDECRIVCNQTYTYKTLDLKTICFTRQLRDMRDKEFFIKLDDDAFIDRDYVVGLVRRFAGRKRPVLIGDQIREYAPKYKDSVHRALYGQGRFYMFNTALLNCIDLDMKYKGHPIEDGLFGAMTARGCGGEYHVDYIQIDTRNVWHKWYKEKGTRMDLAYIKNH